MPRSSRASCRSSSFVVVLFLIQSVTSAANVIDVRPADDLRAAIDRSRAATTRPVTLRLHGGTHRITEPLVLDARDNNLTIEAAPGESPVLSGGRPIGPWRKATLDGKDVFAADVAAFFHFRTS